MRWFWHHSQILYLQSMAAWTLINVTAGLSEHTNTVIEHGAVPLLVKLLSSGSDDGKEQVMSSSISWHNSFEKTIVYACIYIWVDRLHNFNVSCIEQALWALGNIAGNSLTARDLVLNHGALSPLLSLMWNPSSTKKSTWNIATWAFFNFTRGKPLLTLQDQVGIFLQG
jgi:importin subunit alpha-6/7